MQIAHLRQTEGFLTSILALMGVDLRVPDHPTLCRRQGDLNVDLPVQSRHAPIHLVVDSTGLKGYGEGEWKVRQHGFCKRRTWRNMMGADGGYDKRKVGANNYSPQHMRRPETRSTHPTSNSPAP